MIGLTWTLRRAEVLRYEVGSRLQPVALPAWCTSSSIGRVGLPTQCAAIVPIQHSLDYQTCTCGSEAGTIRV
jgi:hypothetical protein